MTPWNKDKAIGQSKPFTINQVKYIKEILQNKRELMQLALFSTAIDTMLRSSDLLKLKIEDVANFDYLKNVKSIKEEINIKQKKTNKSHLVSISQNTQEIILKLINEFKKSELDYLFTSKLRPNKAISYDYYRVFVKKWCEHLGLDPKNYSTHSLRRTRASIIFEETKNPEVVRILLGQSSLTATSHYLGIAKKDAQDISRKYMI